MSRGTPPKKKLGRVTLSVKSACSRRSEVMLLLLVDDDDD